MILSVYVSKDHEEHCIFEEEKRQDYLNQLVGKTGLQIAVNFGSEGLLGFEKGSKSISESW